MIQREAGTDGEDETDPAPAATNWDILESAPTGTSSMGTPWSWLGRIPEEEESSVKDSATSGLPLKQPKANADASGSGEPLMPPSKVYAHDSEALLLKRKRPLRLAKPKKKGRYLWVP